MSSEDTSFIRLLLNSKSVSVWWDITKVEIDSVITKCMRLRQYRKRSGKKHLFREAVRKIKYKECM